MFTEVPPKFIGVVPLKFTVLAPKLSAVPDDIFEIAPIFAVNPLVLKVPLATASMLTVKASASEMTAVDPFNVTPIFIVVEPGNVFPFDVMEKEPEVARKLTVQVPGFVSVMPAEKVIPPWTVNVELVITRLPVNPVQFRVRQILELKLRETATAPEAALRNTSSTLVGTDAPPGPPDVVAHLVPAVPSQDPAPPTQYRSAIYSFLFGGLWCYRYQPVVHTLLLHGCKLLSGKGVVFRQMQGIPKNAVLGFKFKDDLDHGQACVTTATTSQRVLFALYIQPT